MQIDNTQIRRQQEIINQQQTELYRYSIAQQEMAERIYQLEAELAALKQQQTEVRQWTN